MGYITTKSSEKQVYTDFKFEKSTINTEYNKMITENMENCKNKNERQLKVCDLLKKLQQIDTEQEGRIIEEALKNSATAKYSVHPRSRKEPGRN